MAYTYEIIATKVPNAIMRARYKDNVLVNYMIRPAEGYVLHDNIYDLPIYEPVYDNDGNWIDEIDTGRVILGYRPTEGSVSPNYDWIPIEMLDEAGNTVTAYGDRQFFCKLATDVPADQIFGVTNLPEIM